jgi:hypothetical protein
MEAARCSTRVRVSLFDNGVIEMDVDVGCSNIHRRSTRAAAAAASV